MTKHEAIEIMIDVALKRKPHSRVEINLAKHLLEPVKPPHVKKVEAESRN